MLTIQRLWLRQPHQWLRRISKLPNLFPCGIQIGIKMPTANALPFSSAPSIQTGIAIANAISKEIAIHVFMNEWFHAFAHWGTHELMNAGFHAFINSWTDELIDSRIHEFQGLQDIQDYARIPWSFIDCMEFQQIFGILSNFIEFRGFHGIIHSSIYGEYT